MKLEKRKLTGREKDEAAIELLEKLREQLYTSNLNVVRQTAYHLSWMQEDGLEVLEEALFHPRSSRRTKNAATYGLRKMRGRMTKPALLMIKKGSTCSNPDTAKACKNAIDILLNRKPKGKFRRSNAKRRPSSPRFEIRDLPPKGNRQQKPRRVVSHNPPRR